MLEASSAPEATLLQVDLHGALLHVTRARQAGHVGTAGIVLKDTRNAFHIVTESKVTRGVFLHTWTPDRGLALYACGCVGALHSVCRYVSAMQSSLC